MTAKRIALLLTVFLVTLATGCGGGAVEPEPAPPIDEPAAVAKPALDDPKVVAVLAMADRADEAEDHVIARCPGCALAMEGSPDHALQVGEFELRFCSEDCKERFSEDLVASVLDLPTPEE